MQRMNPLGHTKEFFSYSRIDSFSTCARKDWFKYTLLFPIKGTYATQSGSLIHLLLEQFFSAIWASFEEYSLQDSNEIDLIYINKETLVASDKSSGNDWCFSLSKRFPLLDKDSVLSTINVTFPNTINALNARADVVQEVGGENLFYEKKLLHEYEDFTFIGFIDVCKIEGDEAWIFDYKSSKEPVAKYKQLKYYAYYLAKEYPEVKKFHLQIYFTKHDILKQKTIDVSELEEIGKEIDKSIAKIRNDKKGLATKTALCNYCDFKDACEDFNKFKSVFDKLGNNKSPTAGDFYSDKIVFHSGSNSYTKNSLKTLANNSYLIDTSATPLDLIDELVSLNTNAKELWFFDSVAKKKVLGVDYKKGNVSKVSGLIIKDMWWVLKT